MNRKTTAITPAMIYKRAAIMVILATSLLSATPFILFDVKAQTVGSSSTINGQGSTNTIACGTNSISTQSTSIVFSASKTTGALSGRWTITGSVYNPSTGLTTPFFLQGLIKGGGISPNNNYKLTGFLNADTLCNPNIIAPTATSATISGACGTSVPINFKAIVLAAPGSPQTTETATFTGNVVCT
jgi:hypothetical protein